MASKTQHVPYINCPDVKMQMKVISALEREGLLHPARIIATANRFADMEMRPLDYAKCPYIQYSNGSYDFGYSPFQGVPMNSIKQMINYIRVHKLNV